jgi:molybdopterin biosynthesis enzyme
MSAAIPPYRDVRMKGFAARARVRTALEWVDSTAVPLPQEPIEISGACGRRLAEDMVSEIDVPPFPRSAMDGYALRGLETIGASEYNPLPFRLAGESLPGRPFEGELPAAAAVRIMTGAPVPVGADAVVPAEWADEASGTVLIQNAVPPGKNIGIIGEDIRAGTGVLPAGRVLRPQDIGLLASIGRVQVSVTRRPRVRIVATGNELVPPGAERRSSQIVDSNSIMLRALVERDGGTIECSELIPDDRAAIRSRLMAPGADVILVSGGSSVGAEDFAPSLIAELQCVPPARREWAGSAARWCSCCREIRSPACVPMTFSRGVRSGVSEADRPIGPTRPARRRRPARSSRPSGVPITCACRWSRIAWSRSACRARRSFPRRRAPLGFSSFLKSWKAILPIPL